MKLLQSVLLASSAQAASEPTFPQWFLDRYDENLSFLEFQKLYPALKEQMGWNGNFLRLVLSPHVWCTL